MSDLGLEKALPGIWKKGFNPLPWINGSSPWPRECQPRWLSWLLVAPGPFNPGARVFFLPTCNRGVSGEGLDNLKPPPVCFHGLSSSGRAAGLTAPQCTATVLTASSTAGGEPFQSVPGHRGKLKRFPFLSKSKFFTISHVRRTQTDSFSPTNASRRINQ